MTLVEILIRPFYLKIEYTSVITKIVNCIYFYDKINQDKTWCKTDRVYLCLINVHYATKIFKLLQISFIALRHNFFIRLNY